TTRRPVPSPRERRHSENDTKQKRQKRRKHKKASGQPVPPKEAVQPAPAIRMLQRKTCKACGCDRLTHSVYHEELGSVRERLGLREARVNHHSHDSPPGLTAKQTELYWQSLAEREPSNAGGATGAAAWRAWRPRALASQLPKQDLSLAHCRHIEDADRKQFEDFVAARNEIALDIGVARQHHGTCECMGCNKPIRTGSIVVDAPRLGEEAPFHPGCFCCADCGEVLVELAYCALDGRLYCVRHYDERLKPRCHACDEVRSAH
ncbi:hypothetical protein ACJJTC_006773, partial [Scirpophaga incertulas]